MPNKKILHIAESFAGGVFHYLATLCNDTANRCDIVIAYGRRPDTPPDFRKFFNGRIRFVEIKNFTRNICLKKDLKAVRELRKLIRLEEPDIIHLHSSKAGAIGRLAVSGRKYEMYYTPHGYSFLMNDIPARKRRLYFHLEKLLGRKRCTTIACGKSELREAKKVTKRVVRINNGVDIGLLNRIPTEDADDGVLRVATLGRICAQKNPKMFNKIALSHPEAEFIWVGDGDERDELTAPNVTVTGWLDRETALSRIGQADVFIMTSRWEGLPLALLEAMYLEKICIVTDVEGNRDIVQNGKNGFVCASEEEFSRTLDEIYEADLLDIVTCARREIYENYSARLFCDRYAALYRLGAAR